MLLGFCGDATHNEFKATSFCFISIHYALQEYQVFLFFFKSIFVVAQPHSMVGHVHSGLGYVVNIESHGVTAHCKSIPCHCADHSVVKKKHATMSELTSSVPEQQKTNQTRTENSYLYFPQLRDYQVLKNKGFGWFDFGSNVLTEEK